MMSIVRLRSAVASEGIGQEFIYIIAAVIGGCLLTGGYGSVVGASIGAIIFGMARVGIVFAGWDTDWFYSFLGIMLLAAVLVTTPPAGGPKRQRRCGESPDGEGGGDVMAEPLLEVRNITKLFGSVIALTTFPPAVYRARSPACWEITAPANRR